MGGHKITWLFPREESGKVKHKYHRRKVVWDCIATLIRAGVMAQVAIDRVYQVYGANTTVTRIIQDKARSSSWHHASIVAGLVDLCLLD
jgi:hypothetical protein